MNASTTRFHPDPAPRRLRPDRDRRAVPHARHRHEAAAGSAPAVEGTLGAGIPDYTIAVIGAIELVCLVLYPLAGAAVLGAIVLAGYLGGAIATHVRVGNPLLTHTLFPIYVAAMLWGGLYLREPRLRALLPLRRA